MKNQTLIVIGAVVILLGVGGFLVVNQNKSKTLVSQETKNESFTSIRDALSRSLSLECDFTDEEGNKTKSYIKNGLMRADITSAKEGESGSVVIKDKKIYFWNVRGEGFAMAMPEENSDDKTNNQANEVIKDVEKYKESCKTASVADSIFDIPSNIKFSDISEILKSTPNSATVPAVDSKEYEDLLKKYSP